MEIKPVNFSFTDYLKMCRENKFHLHEEENLEEELDYQFSKEVESVFPEKQNE